MRKFFGRRENQGDFNHKSVSMLVLPTKKCSFQTDFGFPTAVSEFLGLPTAVSEYLGLPIAVFRHGFYFVFKLELYRQIS